MCRISLGDERCSQNTTKTDVTEKKNCETLKYPNIPNQS